MSPGLGVDKSIQSADDLKNHRENVHHWGPQELVKALLADGFSTKLTNPNTSKVESLADLICFGSNEVTDLNFRATNSKFSLQCDVLNICAKVKNYMLQFQVLKFRARTLQFLLYSRQNSNFMPKHQTFYYNCQV